MLFYIFHFTCCVLSGISSVLFFTFIPLICLNLVLKGEWLLFFICLIIALISYLIRNRFSKYIIDITLNFGVFLFVLGLTHDIKWFYPISESIYKIYFIVVLIWGFRIGMKEMMKAKIIKTLKQLDNSSFKEVEDFSRGTFEDRVVFDLNTRDAATVISHFLQDPRIWLIPRGIVPSTIPTESSYNIHEKKLWARHKTIMGSIMDIEVLRFIRIGRDKFLLRIETDSKDWYIDSLNRYSDFRRAVYRTGARSL